MEHLCLYRGSMRGTWTEISHTGDSERHAIEGSGNSAFVLYGSIEPYKKCTVEPKAFIKGGLGQ